MPAEWFGSDIDEPEHQGRVFYCTLPIRFGVMKCSTLPCHARLRQRFNQGSCIRVERQARRYRCFPLTNHLVDRPEMIAT
jgi:hypothetical protein